MTKQQQIKQLMADQIISYRQQKGVSQLQLAKLAGVTERTIYNFENPTEKTDDIVTFSRKNPPKPRTKKQIEKQAIPGETYHQTNTH